MLTHFITEHAAKGDVRIQQIGNVTYPTQAAMLQAATTEAQRIRARRVAELSRASLGSDPGLQISRNGSGTVAPNWSLNASRNTPRRRGR